MRRLFLAAIFASLPAWACAYSTYGAYVPPEGLQTAQPLTPAATAISASGTWGFDLRAGAALPLGGEAKDNGIGGMGGADVYYQLNPKWDLDLLGLYMAMPYTATGGGSSNPLGAEGLAVKADYQVFSSDQTTAWVGFGLGFMGQQISQHEQSSPIGQYPIEYSVVPQSSEGPALLAAGGVGYAFYPQWTANLELLIVSVDAMGGTSNNLLAAVPGLFVKWTY